MTSTQLITERLILRPIEERDLELIVEYAGDEGIAMMTLTMPHPYDLDDAKQFLEITQNDWESNKAYTFAITHKMDEALMGVVGLHPSTMHHRAEIGYWIGKPHWNKGYMTEAARRVVQFGFEELELHRIYAWYFEDNPASGRIMAKVGMQQEGMLRDHYYRWGRFRTAYCYGILREDYEAGLAAKG